MVLISHRGNISGKNPEMENTTGYIEKALLKFNVEIDVWITDLGIFLGHDAPITKVPIDFVLQEGLWIHCKNILALSVLSSIKHCNCFFHNNDDVTLTSMGYLWTYPGKELYSNSICVLPSAHYVVSDVAGICSDCIGDYI